MADLRARAAALLEQLTSLPAVSGREDPLREFLKESLTFADEVWTDALGNLYARLKANASSGEKTPKLMLAAHMDEIGLVVTAIEKSGALRVAPVGGVDLRNLLAAQVIVHTQDGPLPGVIGTIPPHLTQAKDRTQLPSWDDLYIDLGLDAEAVLSRVCPGDPVSMRREGTWLANGRYTGKALDNRAGLAAAIAACEALAERCRPADVILVATAQEEVGMRGAVVAAQSLSPDVAIAIDVGFADMPGLARRETIQMGKGPALSIGANIHPGVRELLVQAAQEAEIDVQVEVLPASSGTDAWPIQVANQGVPTGIVSIPLRYMHSTVEVVDIADVAQAAELLAQFAAMLTAERMGGWHGERITGSTE